MKNQQAMDKKIRAVQDSMLTMHEQRRQIMDEQDPMERQRLMHQHREEMYQHMLITRASGTLGQSSIGSQYEQKSDNDYS